MFNVTQQINLDPKLSRKDVDLIGVTVSSLPQVVGEDPEQVVCVVAAAVTIDSDGKPTAGSVTTIIYDDATASEAQNENLKRDYLEAVAAGCLDNFDTGPTHMVGASIRVMNALTEMTELGAKAWPKEQFEELARLCAEFSYRLGASVGISKQEVAGV